MSTVKFDTFSELPDEIGSSKLVGYVYVSFSLRGNLGFPSPDCGQHVGDIDCRTLLQSITERSSLKAKWTFTMEGPTVWSSSLKKLVL